MKLNSGSRVFVHGQSAVPYQLLESFVQGLDPCLDLEFIHLHLEGMPVHFLPEYRSRFKINNLFVSPSLRNAIDGHKIDYTPIFLSEVPKLFKSGQFPIDVALVHVSPPDADGFCTLGVGVDIARAAVDSARIVIAQINQQMPRTFGHSKIHISRFAHKIEIDTPLPQSFRKAESQNDQLNAIGKNIANLIEDGSTLQMGIGAIPDAVLKYLGNHKNLGIHSELCSDGIIDLIQNGAVNNSEKMIYPGKTISSFIQGSKKIYDFIHNNPLVELHPSDFVNSPAVIAQNPKVVAINSAVEIDLTGQVCSDSVGHKMISGVGGQIDFIRGAAQSSGGKPIIAITSRTQKGDSRIVPTLHDGAGVVTTRADVHYVVTEYGAVNLYGKSLGERAQALISIAHPEERHKLDIAWRGFY